MATALKGVIAPFYTTKMMVLNQDLLANFIAAQVDAKEERIVLLNTGEMILEKHYQD